MSYIWEDYNSKNYYYMPDGKQSYYEEIWKKCKKNIPVNIYNRFQDVFFPEALIKEKSKIIELNNKYKHDKKYRDVVNLILHQLVFFDRIRGITLDEIKMAILYDEINQGYFGNELKDYISELKFCDLYVVLKEYIKSLESTYTVFDEVLKLLFGKIFIYNERYTQKIMICIEKVRTEYNEKLFFILKFLFANMRLNIEVFWKNEHFGIIDNEETMRIDNLAIY